MKKVLIFSIFIFSFSLSKAQWVTIPDANFVTWLQSNYPSCMNGNLMDTTCSGILNATTVECSSQNISDLTGIQYFNSLTNLFCQLNQLTNLPTLPNSLTILACGSNSLASLPTLPNSLTTLNCESNSLFTLPTLPNSLTILDCDDNYSLNTLPSLPNSLTSISCGGGSLTTLPTLPNSLTNLVCFANQLTTLPTLPNSLTSLGCVNNLLTTLPTLPNSLTILECGGNYLTTLPVLPNSLNILNCGYNSLTFLPSLPNSLTELYCSHNLISNISILPNALIYLDCSNNSLTNLPSLPNSLTELWCNNNFLNTLPSLPNLLSTLICHTNSLNTLPPLPNLLTLLYCYNNSLNTLPALPNSLINIRCYNNSLTTLPALPNPLYEFLINNNPGLMCIPPLIQLTSNNFNISNTGITCLPNIIQHFGYFAAIDTMPICEVFNTNGCEVGWNIKGNAVLDGDSSCVTISDGTGIPMVKMNLYDSGNNLLQQVIANWGGDYSFDTQLGNFSTSVDTMNLPFNLLCPSNNSIISNFTTIDSMDYNVDFRFVCKPGFDIGAINVQSTNFFPGNITPIHIVAGDITQSIYNVSCNPGINGEVKVVINGPANYLSPLIGALTPTVNGDTLIYSIADFSLVNSNTDFAFNVITDSTAQTGDQICFDVTVTPTASDNNISNNSLTHCFTVSNSYDPNEKEVSPVGSLAYPFNDWLTYTIHFQNTGTAAAHHIQILDTLDADLDASTFQLLSYSHAPMVQLFGSNVKFNFVNINLPDSTIDFEGSKGYVSYRVKPLANLPLGTTIENTASIYFDFNTSVVTNTVSNVICNPITPTTISQTICAGDSYNFNGTNISATGNYSATLNAINGCDSVVNLNLTVETINTTIQQSNDTLTSTSNGTIQWFDCNTQQFISGATGNNFIASTSGNYAAIITQGNCIDTSDCILVSGFGFVVSGYEFTVFPNPAEENITVTISQPCENCRIEISNTLGQILFSEKLNDKSETINLKSFSSGIYFIALRSDKLFSVKKLIKN